MKRKTVLFTGASGGMGHFAAIELARRGAEILVVGHNDARGAAVVDAIRASGGSAEFQRADMGDAADVLALADAVLARNGSIDVLIHSAGGMPPSGALRGRVWTSASHRTSWAPSFSRACSRSASSRVRRRA